MIKFFYFILFFFISFVSLSNETEKINDEMTYINSQNIFFDNENNKVTLGANSYVNNDEVTLVANGG